MWVLVKVFVVLHPIDYEVVVFLCIFSFHLKIPLSCFLTDVGKWNADDSGGVEFHL